jgi:RNA polymerase sigma-B factor
MTHRELLVARYCAERTIERRNELIDAHRHLCRRGAKKFKRAYNDHADLEQVAAIGLIKAADYYRGEMRTPFEAYAWIMIVGELMHHVRDHERLVRLPRRLRTLEKHAAAYWDGYTARHHREPSTRETALALGVTVQAIDELRATRRPEHLSLPDPCETEGPERVDLLAEPEPALSDEERLALALALEELGERERAIVLGTFAVGLTQRELGERLGLSQSHVSKLLSRALGKLAPRVA